MNEKKSAGIHIENVSGNVKLKAGGDIVGGDKVTTTNAGFGDHAQQQEFLTQLDELRSTLREIKSQVDTISQFDEDAKDQLVMEILQQVAELKQVKQDAEQLEPGHPPPPDKLQSLGQRLDKARGLLDKIKAIADTASGLAQSVVPIVAKALPILASARHLIGIP